MNEIDARDMLTVQQASVVREQWLQADACLRNPSLWEPGVRRPSWVQSVVKKPAFGYYRREGTDLWLPDYRCAYVVINGEAAGSVSTTSVTTQGVTDYTGSNLIVIGVGSYTATTEPTTSDSAGNPWTPLTKYEHPTLPRVRMHYCYNPTITGVGQTFTASSGATASYPGIVVIGVSGSTTSPFDQENGATGSSVTTLSTGNITPTQDSEFIVSTVAGQGYATGDPTGFTRYTFVTFVGGVNWGVSLAYAIQTTATTTACSWPLSASGAYAASIASFKAAATGRTTKNTRAWTLGDEIGMGWRIPT